MNRSCRSLSALACVILMMHLISSCANIIPPVGGDKDTLPPRLIKGSPAPRTTAFKGDRIVLQFDEYVELQNSFENVVVSPSQEKAPSIDSKLRTVTIKLKDTLEPNTTYSIQFGNAIKDVNEGNVLKGFSYVFSTGNAIDSLSLEGEVTIAETGKVDSTLIVVLYNKLDDSAVAKLKPRYLTHLDGKGHFRFENLPHGTYNVFALKDEGFKRYNSNRIMFAFADAPIKLGTDNAPVMLSAFVGEKDTVKKQATRPFMAPTASKENKEDKRLRFSTDLQNGQQDLLKELHLDFQRPLKEWDSSKFMLMDTSYNTVKGFSITLDTSRKRLSLSYPWKEEQLFKLLILKGAATDTIGNSIQRNDTISIRTRQTSSYGSIMVRFSGLDLKKNPVLQWIAGDAIISSHPLTSPEWSAKLFEPGTYDIRILYDMNKNGKWDTGDYWKKLQPEKVVGVDKHFNVRANWDNEFNIEL